MVFPAKVVGSLQTAPVLGFSGTLPAGDRRWYVPVLYQTISGISRADCAVDRVVWLLACRHDHVTWATSHPFPQTDPMADHVATFRGCAHQRFDAGDLAGPRL